MFIKVDVPRRLVKHLVWRRLLPDASLGLRVARFDRYGRVVVVNMQASTLAVGAMPPRMWVCSATLNYGSIHNRFGTSCPAMRPLRGAPATCRVPWVFLCVYNSGALSRYNGGELHT
jgi:hypothetical protein